MFEDRIRPEFLRSLDGIRFGRLRLTTPDGATRVFAGDQPGPDAALTIEDWRTVPALAAKGESTILNAEMVDRGYVAIERELAQLGANIERVV